MGLKNDMIGTWNLCSYTLRDAQGNKYFPLGNDCKGYLMYTEDGHVSAQIMKIGRKPYVSGNLLEGTIEEMAEAAHGYVAYAGTYEIDEEAMTIMHNIQMSMNPIWENQNQVRYVKMEYDLLTITTDVDSAVLKWEKNS